MDDITNNDQEHSEIESLNDNNTQQEQNESAVKFDYTLIEATNQKSPEDEYDTDIEIKENYDSYDHSGKTAYIQQCYKEGVIPAGYFLRHINGKKLEMRHHGLGLCGIKPICSSLMTNGTITSLDLTDNWLGDQSVPYLMVMMKENCFITELILTNNNFTHKCAEMISLGLADNHQISRLDLSKNSFDDRSAVHFADLIMNTDKLVYLNLSKNKFGSGCLITLGKAISQARNLEELDLGWNHITGKEVKQFCSGLIENSTIKILHLGWNGLGTMVCMNEISKMIKLNTTLEELDLSNNRITAEGAVILGKGLTANGTLKTLRLGQNPMQTAGCYAVLSATLKNLNSSITFLDFENIRVNHDFLELRSAVPEKLTIHTGSRKPSRPSSSIHPMVRLKKFVKKQKLPLLKYFKPFDDSENMNVTRNDFLLCLQLFCQETNFELTEKEIGRLLDYLDKKQNGLIHYEDFMELNFTEETAESETPGPNEDGPANVSIENES